MHRENRALDRSALFTPGYQGPGVVELTRDATYADSDALAKTQEEELLWRDMESDLVQQLMRRLAAAKPTAPTTPE